MAIAKYNNKCNPARCFDSAEYITRLSKAEEIHFHNLDDIENSIDKDDLENRRAAAMAYGKTRQKESAANPRIKNGTERQDRNHQTLILSWDRGEETEKAGQLTKEFLDEKFKDARCIYTIHQDKDGQTHAHVFVDTKKENGKSFQLKARDYYTLDEAWAQKYDRQYGTDYNKEFTEKKRETAAWKKEYAFAKKHNQPLPEKPERSNDIYKQNLQENLKKRDLENAGAKPHDKNRIDGDKRIVTKGRSRIKQSQQTLDNSGRELDRAAATVDGTIREAKTLRDDIARRDITRDRDTGIER
jgi:hypothetical protein